MGGCTGLMARSVSPCRSAESAVRWNVTVSSPSMWAVIVISLVAGSNTAVSMTISANSEPPMLGQGCAGETRQPKGEEPALGPSGSGQEEQHHRAQEQHGDEVDRELH